MSTDQMDNLLMKLEKGLSKTQKYLSALAPDQWRQVIYPEPYPWTLRDLLAHFVSAEERLLVLAKDFASGGGGVPPDFDFNEFNRQELECMAGLSSQALLSSLTAARHATLDWVRTLDESHLQRLGAHPVLGEIDLETMIKSIYGHQLLHMRDVIAKFGSGK